MPRLSRLASQRRKLMPKIARAFARRGYRGATTAEIARACGVKEAILYRHWSDKQAMFIAAIEHVFDASIKTWNQLIRDLDASAAARRLLAYEARHHGEFGLYRLLFAGLGECRDPRIAAALRRTYLRFARFLQRRIALHWHGRDRHGAATRAAWAFVGLGTVANIGRELTLLGDRARARLLSEMGGQILEFR